MCVCVYIHTHTHSEPEACLKECKMQCDDDCWIDEGGGSATFQIKYMHTYIYIQTYMYTYTHTVSLRHAPKSAKSSAMMIAGLMKGGEVQHFKSSSNAMLKKRKK